MIGRENFPKLLIYLMAIEYPDIPNNFKAVEEFPVVQWSIRMATSNPTYTCPARRE